MDSGEDAKGRGHVIYEDSTLSKGQRSVIAIPPLLREGLSQMTKLMFREERVEEDATICLRCRSDSILWR